MEEDFKEFLKLLEENKVQYMIVGGLAVAYYGYPRYTGDIDIWISNSEENAFKMVKVMNDFGFGSLGIKKEDFLKNNNVIQLGHEPVRIDIMNGLSGLNFEEAIKNISLTKIGEISVKFISLEDLKKNKKSTAREQDILDIKKLEKIKSKK